MESESKKSNFADEEGYRKLILIFKLFFTSLLVMMGALIIYLVQSESSDQSIHQNSSVQFSSTESESEIFKLSLGLERAAQELENATALIHSADYSASDKDAKTQLALSNCEKYLHKGSGQLREAIPFPRSTGKDRVRMANRIVKEAEENINSCLDELATADANEVREKVFVAAEFLSERGQFLISRRWKTIDIDAVILENLVVICLYALQMSFIFFLFWKIFKSP